MIRPSPPYTIRPMEPGDIPAVVAIDRLSFPTPWPASSYLYELRHSGRSCFRVLLKPESSTTVHSERKWRSLLRDVMSQPEGDRITGYVGFRRQDMEAHISTIAVHPEWRGRGLGELLLLTALEEALGLQVDLVTLEVRTSNRVAQRLYDKYGFQFTGTHRGYYRDGEDAWLMALRVDKNGYQMQLAELRRRLEKRLRRRQQVVGQRDRIRYNHPADST